MFQTGRLIGAKKHWDQDGNCFCTKGFPCLYPQHLPFASNHQLQAGSSLATKIQLRSRNRGCGHCWI